MKTADDETARWLFEKSKVDLDFSNEEQKQNKLLVCRKILV
jgi:hypothetical protein